MRFVLSLFLVDILCYNCAKTLNVTQTSPLRINTILSEGEIYCINSQLPYLTVIFSFTNLLSVRYYVHDSKLQGSFRVPGKFGGFDFAEQTGSLEIESLLDGPLNISLFAFPDRCSGIRYISNLDPDEFTIQRKFGVNRFLDIGSSFCIWYTERLSLLSVQPSSSIEICKQSNCSEVNSDNSRLTNLNYLIVTPQTGDFMETFNFRFSALRGRSPLKISELLYPTGEPSLIELSDDLWDIDVHNLFQGREKFIPREDERFRHDHHSTSDPMIWYLLLVGIIVTSTLIACVGLSVYCVRMRPKKEGLPSEQETLLRENDPRRFQPYFYQVQNPYPMPGVYFPAVVERS